MPLGLAKARPAAKKRFLISIHSLETYALGFSN